MKVPEVNRCCCCCSLRWGIILFGYVNVVFSVAAVVCYATTTELQRSSAINNSSLEAVNTAVLFSIFGMVVLLNILLLIAGYQKDILILKLYNRYAIVTTVAATICLLISRLQLLEICAALFAIAMQCYIILLVRSEVSKLEKKRNKPDEESISTNEEIVDVPDRDTLL